MHQNNSRRASVKYQLYNFTRENSYPVNRAFKYQIVRNDLILIKI